VERRRAGEHADGHGDGGRDPVVLAEVVQQREQHPYGLEQDEGRDAGEHEGCRPPRPSPPLHTEVRTTPVAEVPGTGL
jgi:hypothetical protein